MTLMFVGSAVLLVIALLFILFPLIKKSDRVEQDVLTNTQVIKARLAELEKEVDEGVLSEQDKQQAIEELKLALLDENRQQQDTRGNIKLPLIVGGFISLTVSLIIYIQANQVSQVQDWQNAMERLPELSRRVVIEADQTIQPQDLDVFALGIRTKLLENPDDAIGWLLLGRIHASLNRLETAFQAYEKALALDPEHTGALTSYSQGLIMTGQERYMQKGLSLLQRLIRHTPDDINAIGMLAVTATQLGELDLALQNWLKLQNIMPDSAPMKEQVNLKVAELQAALSGEPSNEPSIQQSAKNAQIQQTGKRVELNIELSPELQEKLPQSGFLFVFAQDANGESRMPAAVVKTPLVNLPVTVELSDTNAMMANYTLSQLSRTRLVARISSDGNVAQSPGELQGEIVVELVNGSNGVQHILINKELM